MTKHLIYILFVALILLKSTTASALKIDINNPITLLTTETEFEAGSTITLKFTNTESINPNLYLSYGYGTSIVKPLVSATDLVYEIPEFISKKTGVITWQLLTKKASVNGEIQIKPKQEVASMETYLGPPSIEAGGKDYSMLVAIPTDIFDNPLVDGTEVTAKHQFLKHETKTSIFMKNGISYKNIYSETKTGRILVSSTCLNKNSKEFTLNVMPAIPTNFKIAFNQNHDYADGNQITRFSTSIIKDQYKNIVSDGTFVEFFIETANNVILKTSGTTINGIAIAKMIHPDHKDQWQVKAYVEGMAESNVINLSFKQAVIDYNVVFSENNRTVTVGPLKSFMDQMIPDGLSISVSVYKNKKLVKTFIKGSFNGYTTLKLDTNIFPKGEYSFKIKAAGIEKTYNTIKL